MDEYRTDVQWLHVYAQHINHNDARIEGTRQALTTLRDAIDRALSSGREAEASPLCTTDGEGYCIVVNIRTPDALAREGLPYVYLAIEEAALTKEPTP